MNLAAVAEAASDIPWPLTLALLALGPCFTYLVTRRRYSGGVGTTEAGRLWNEQSNYINRLESKIAELENNISNERLLRKFEVLKLRVSNHSLRNQLMTLQFMTHPDIPESFKREVQDRQSEHISELEEEVESLHTALQAKGILP